MIRLLIGKENFMKGLWSYYTKFKHGNASRSDWIKAMEDASGQNLTGMAHTWLKQTGYPTVNATINYDEKTKTFTIHLVQSGFKNGNYWEFPFDAAILDKNGKELGKKLIRINGIEQDIVFKNVARPAIVSLNRGYSFYGKVVYDASEEELYLQAEKDTDLINRYIAFYTLADREKMRLLKEKNTHPSEKFIKLFHSVLNDKKLLNEMSSSMLAVTEGVEDETYNHKYQDLFEIREKIFKKIAEKYKDELIKLYKEYDVVKTDGTYLENELANIKKRGIKNSCLGILSKLDTKDIHELIKRQFEAAKNTTDKALAFSAYLRSSAKDRLDVMKQYEQECSKSLILYEIFLGRIASSEAADVVDLIKKVISSKNYDIKQANHQRAIYEVFANHKRMSLLTEKGREFLKEGLIKLAQLNEYNTGRCLDVFGKMDFLEHRHQIPVVQLLLDVLITVDENKQPSVYNTIRRILNHSPKAVEAYEKKHGKLRI
jgi:aminopeptidase N